LRNAAPSVRQPSDPTYFRTSCNPCPWEAQPPPVSLQQAQNEHDAKYDDAITAFVETFVIVDVRSADGSMDGEKEKKRNESGSGPVDAEKMRKRLWLLGGDASRRADVVKRRGTGHPQQRRLKLSPRPRSPCPRDVPP
jgi:hypothetical protein